MKNKYPIYIVSKGRWESRLTMKALDRLGLTYRVVVEASEFDNYAEHIPPDRLLILPQFYLDMYDTCDELGDTKSRGPGAARNFVWDCCQFNGDERYWVMDDNLDDFHRLNRNIKSPVRTGACFRAMEDFVDRYKNVILAGPNYYSFAKATDKVPPLVLNTRIYSCLLIQTNAPYRWRGRYNEDTDLSLRVLKDGLCTVQFNAFLCGKVTTQRMKGGNTDEFYANEGTAAKSQMIEDLHPDVAEAVVRFNRPHHVVDYTPFKNNLLVRDPSVEIGNGVNNYGMVRVHGARQTNGLPFKDGIVELGSDPTLFNETS